MLEFPFPFPRSGAAPFARVDGVAGGLVVAATARLILLGRCSLASAPLVLKAKSVGEGVVTRTEFGKGGVVWDGYRAELWASDQGAGWDVRWGCERPPPSPGASRVRTPLNGYCATCWAAVTVRRRRARPPAPDPIRGLCPGRP